MPVYLYKCDDCGTKQEILHKTYSEEAEIKCENCGSAELKKMITSHQVSSSSSSQMPDMPAAPPMGGGCANGMCGLN